MRDGKLQRLLWIDNDRESPEFSLPEDHLIHEAFYDP